MAVPENGKEAFDKEVPPAGNDDEVKVPSNEPQPTNPVVDTGDHSDPEANTGSEKDSKKKSKGAWISQLPRELRDKFDPEEYPDLKSLAQKVLGIDVDEEPADNTDPENGGEGQTDEEDWSTLEVTDDESEDGETMKSLVENLKKSGVKASDAKKMLQAMSESAKGRSKRIFETYGKKLDGKLKAKWGDDYATRKTYMQNGFRTLYRDETSQKAMIASGIMLNPEFCHALSEIGRLTKESRPPKGTGAPEPKKPVHGLARWSK